MRQLLRPRNLVWLAIALGVAALVALALQPQPLAVDLAIVDRGDIVVTVGDEGRTRVRQVYVVSAPIPGRMLRIESEPGDTVIGQQTVLARFLPVEPSFLDLRTRRQAEASVEAAESALVLVQAERDRATAELEFARNELKRAKALSERGAISASALDRALTAMETRRATLATANAAFEMRRHELENARAALIEPSGKSAHKPSGCCIDLVAPVDGQVLQILQKSEVVVTAGTPLIEIGDPGDLEVVVDLLSTDAVRLNEGAAVIIEGWGGEPPLSGQVRRIEPFGFTKVSALGIEEQRVNIVIDFSTAPPDRLGHGFRVEVRIVVTAYRDVLRVPLNALFRDRDDWAVFVANDGVARQRVVTIGETDGRMAAVLEGLAEGEQVVVHPGDRIDDGSGIVPR